MNLFVLSDIQPLAAIRGTIPYGFDEFRAIIRNVVSNATIKLLHNVTHRNLERARCGRRVMTRGLRLVRARKFISSSLA